MSLKQLIHRQKLMRSGAVYQELTLPGEPLIYSIRFNIKNRKHTQNYFRNKQWKSLFKCVFRSFHKTHQPVVVLVRFYVTPPERCPVKVSAAALKAERTPAVYCWEVCDYLLSFLEMLYSVLFNSYKQIVKIEVDKFYSSNPRTVFKFMKWDEYEDMQNYHPDHAEGQGVLANRQARRVQSELQGHGENPGVGESPDASAGHRDVPGAAPCDSALQDPCAEEPVAAQAEQAARAPAPQKARRRQPRKVPE